MNPGRTLPANPVVQALAARVRSAGSAPLLTWYRPETGVRTELSTRTFANWVDKTANLLQTIGAETQVAGPVSVDHPGHWMSLLWPVAAWQAGCAYLAGQPDGDTELAVVGPEAPRQLAGLPTLACSLHPLGLGLGGLPDGVLDFTSEALAEPDVHWAAPVAEAGVAWLDTGREFSHADTAAVQPQAGRVLVRPGDAWETLAAAVVGPVLGGGSAVVVEGPADEAQLDRIRVAERVGGPMA